MTTKFNKNVRNVLATSFLAATFALGTGQAFANEDVTNNENEAQLVDVVDETESNTTIEEPTIDSETQEANEELNESSPEESEDQTSVDTQTQETVEENATQEPISIIDFFNNVLNAIQVAIENNDAIEAVTLAKDAQAKINEAEALLAEGNDEQASELLTQALAQQELALQKYEDAINEVEEDAIEEGVQVEESDEELTNEETELADEIGTIESVRAKLEAKFSSNLIALQSALEKVQNPNAKASLAKNVEKAKVRLENKVNKKFAKLVADGAVNSELASEEQNSETDQLVNEQDNISNDTANTIEEENVATTQNVVKVQPKVTEKTNEAIEIANKAKNEQKEVAKKVEKQDGKQQEKAAKQDEKQQEKAVKQDEKQQENAVKQDEKQQENAAKQDEKQQEKAAKQVEKQTEKAEKVESEEKGNKGNENGKN